MTLAPAGNEMRALLGPIAELAADGGRKNPRNRQGRSRHQQKIRPQPGDARRHRRGGNPARGSRETSAGRAVHRRGIGRARRHSRTRPGILADRSARRHARIHRGPRRIHRQCRVDLERRAGAGRHLRARNEAGSCRRGRRGVPRQDRAGRRVRHRRRNANSRAREARKARRRRQPFSPRAKERRFSGKISDRKPPRLRLVGEVHVSRRRKSRRLSPARADLRMGRRRRPRALVRRRRAGRKTRRFTAAIRREGRQIPLPVVLSPGARAREIQCTSPRITRGQENSAAASASGGLARKRSRLFSFEKKYSCPSRIRNRLGKPGAGEPRPIAIGS